MGRLLVLLAAGVLLMLPLAIIQLCAPPATGAPSSAGVVYLADLADGGRAALPLRVIWVESANERFTPAELAGHRAQLGRALNYWRDLAGVPLPRHWTELHHYVGDPFASWAWLKELQLSTRLTIAVVANGHSRAAVELGGGVAAYGYNLPGGSTMFCAAYNDLADGGPGLGLCAAHELGHYLGLPEGGPERAAGGGVWSIMLDPGQAWERWQMHPLDRAGARL